MNQHINAPHIALALFYQATPPPEIDGVKKDMKPGGYSDSCADMAYLYSQIAVQKITTSHSTTTIQLITPTQHPDVLVDTDWCFPDTHDGIDMAIQLGANTLLFNTVLFDGHPIEQYYHKFYVICHDPHQVQLYDDKYYTNSLLRDDHGVKTIPAMLKLTIDDIKHFDRDNHTVQFIDEQILHNIDNNITFPLVLKPIRGRGSQGVEVINDRTTLLSKIYSFFIDTNSRFGSSLYLEKYLSGREITISIAPPGTYLAKVPHDNDIFIGNSIWVQGTPINTSTSLSDNQLNSGLNDNQLNAGLYDNKTDLSHVTFLKHIALPPIYRFNHDQNGIIPYNGIIPVSQNSCPFLLSELTQFDIIKLQEVMEVCEYIGHVLKTTQLIRIDCREDPLTKDFFIFDINFKPNATIAVRPHRLTQDSLVMLAFHAIRYTHTDFLLKILDFRWKKA